MEEIQIVRKENEEWQLIEKIKKDAETASNNLMYLLAEHIEYYGAARSDVLEYLAEHPFPPIRSLSIINEVKKLVQENVSPVWLEVIQDILKYRGKETILLLTELGRAVSADIPFEVFQEGFITENTPYELHIFLEEKIHGFLESMEDKEQKQLHQLDYLVDSLNQYRLKIENLLENMEELLSKQGREIIVDSEKAEEAEEMYFDESLLPAMEFEAVTDMPGSDKPGSEVVAESSNSISTDIDFSGEELVPELDDIPEISIQNDFAEEFIAETPETQLDTGEDEIQEKYNHQEESGRRYKRLMALANRMFALEKHRFLNKPSEEQREFLIKKLLDKKAEISKVNILKSLFGSFSNEYLYDLVIRDATESELRNLLVLQNN